VPWGLRIAKVPFFVNYDSRLKTKKKGKLEKGGIEPKQICSYENESRGKSLWLGAKYRSISS
jgi:hypothetical protein